MYKIGKIIYLNLTCLLIGIFIQAVYWSGYPVNTVRHLRSAVPIIFAAAVGLNGGDLTDGFPDETADRL